MGSATTPNIYLQLYNIYYIPYKILLLIIAIPSSAVVKPAQASLVTLIFNDLGLHDNAVGERN